MIMRKLSTMLVAVLTAILTLYSCANSDKPADVNNFRIQRGTNVSHWLSQNNEDRGEARRQHIQEDDFARLDSLGFDFVRLPMRYSSGTRKATNFLRPGN